MRNRFFLITVLLLCSSGLMAQASDDPIARSYQVKYKTVQEFEPLVQAMLSNRGNITTSTEMNMMVVVDRPAYLSQVDSLFAYFDHPSAQFMLNFHLLLGSDDPEVVQPQDSLMYHELLDNLYSFDRYELLDKVYARVEEKTEVSLDCAQGQFNILVNLDYIPGAGSPIKIRTLELKEYIRDMSGKIAKNIYSASAELVNDQIDIITSVKLESMNRTLILMLSASKIQ